MTQTIASADAEDGTAVAPTVTTPTVAARARRARGPLIVVAALVLVAAFAAIGANPGTGLLDTRSPSKAGSKAVAELLRDQGVSVRQVRTLAEASATSGGTLVVVGSELLTADDARRLAGSDARVVVLVGSPDDAVVDAFAPGTTVAQYPADAGVREPGCALPAAVAAGAADAGDVTYRAGAAPFAGGEAAVATGCYPVGGSPSLLVVASPSRTVTLLGSAAPLQNRRLGREGNAALALNLLGSQSTLTWYLPSINDLYAADQGPRAAKSPLDLVPRGVIWSLWWLAVVVALLALWRARRLGPVVPEALPVVVRGSETVEGRARLYRRGRNRRRAAELLRAATADRLAAAVGLPTGAEPASVVDAVAARTRHAPAEVGALLYGAAPADDAHLVRLADDLDRLDREVHRS